MPRFNRVTIVGLGLIGGSLGMAIRRRRLAKQVVGVSRRPSTLRRAKRCGAIDLGTTDGEAAVQDAEVVILATPVDAVVPTAMQLAAACRPGSILSDVGSSKAHIVRTLERTLPRHLAFVGAHPLAGSEQRGFGAARPELFDGSLCIVTRTPRTPMAALQAVKRLWAPLVRRILIMDPERHDRLLAAVSHVPHLVAACLTTSTSRDGLAVAPRSFLEMTRIAKSEPDLWDDIFLSNRRAVLAAMRAFERHWHTLHQSISRSDRSALRRQLARARSLRHVLPDP